MTSVGVGFALIFAVVQLCIAEYVFYDRKMTLDDNLSLNPNWCHHPLITQLSSCYLILPKLKMHVCCLNFNVNCLRYILYIVKEPDQNELFKLNTVTQSFNWQVINNNKFRVKYQNYFRRQKSVFFAACLSAFFQNLNLND